MPKVSMGETTIYFIATGSSNGHQAKVFEKKNNYLERAFHTVCEALRSVGTGLPILNDLSSAKSEADSRNCFRDFSYIDATQEKTHYHHLCFESLVKKQGFSRFGHHLFSSHGSTSHDNHRTLRCAGSCCWSGCR